MAAWGFSLGMGIGVPRTELGVFLPGQGQPEFSRSRTILGNIFTRGNNKHVCFLPAQSALLISDTSLSLAEIRVLGGMLPWG